MASLALQSQTVDFVVINLTEDDTTILRLPAYTLFENIGNKDDVEAPKEEGATAGSSTTNTGAPVSRRSVSGVLYAIAHQACYIATNSPGDITATRGGIHVRGPATGILKPGIWYYSRHDQESSRRMVPTESRLTYKPECPGSENVSPIGLSNPAKRRRRKRAKKSEMPPISVIALQRPVLIAGSPTCSRTGRVSASGRITLLQMRRQTIGSRSRVLYSSHFGSMRR